MSNKDIENFDNMIYIRIIQKFFINYLRFNEVKKSLIDECLYIKEIISDLMVHLNNCYDLQIINNENYTDYNQDLEIILNDINELQNIILSNRYYYIKSRFFQLCKLKNKFFKDLQKLYLNFGSLSIIKLINYDLNNDLLFENYTKEFIDNLFFYNKILVPLKLSIFNNPSPKNGDKIKISESKDIVLSKNIKSNEYFLDKNFIENISISIPVLLPTLKDSNINNIYKLFIPLKEHKVIIKGYLHRDSLNIFRDHPIVNNRLKNLTNNLNLKLIDYSFYNNYLKQINVADLLIMSANEIKENIQNDYSIVKKAKNKNISNLIKDFMNLEIEKKSHFLTILLINDEDDEAKYLAYLLYDMLSGDNLNNPSYLNLILKNIHWSVQKKFKTTIDDINSKNQKLLGFSDNEISYEKKIYLMKCDDYVKQKALDKYKEISSKSNDSSVKAQQYLDGLLKIPFGIYKEEYILQFLENFKSKLIIFLDYLDDCQYIDTFCYKDLNLKNLSSNTINDFFKHSNLNNLNKQQFSFNIDKFNLKLSKLNQTQLSKIISNLKLGLKKDEISCEEIKQLKLTRNNVKIDLDTLKSSVKKLVENQIKVINTQDEIDNFLKIIKYFSCEVFHSFNTKKKVDNSIVIEKFSSLKEEWKQYNIKKEKYLTDVIRYLDESIYGHLEAKLQIQRIIAQWINGENTGYCFGFEGPPGTGKTSIAKKGLTRCLLDEDGNSRPFSFIAIGGSSNGSTLEGHSYTYVGSTWGKIIDILMEKKCMNPIIFIDELDKISKTENGKELIGILTHITDYSQNTEFMDKYFSGVKIDLSKVLFVFSYNDPSLIDPILLDRIHRVKFNALKKSEKIHITQNYMLKEVNKIIGFNDNDINLSIESISQLIENYTCEAGVRKLRERIFELIREINLRYILNKDIDGQKIEFPFTLNIDSINNDIFIKKQKVFLKKILDDPHIGIVNGLYATGMGMGGITLIETYRLPSSSFLDLELTGQQGDVMKESMKVAKTVAWNLLKEEIKINIKNEIKSIGNYGIHIHCPEGATPKDGPSAGLAITLAILSQLIKVPISNKVAMTGEINLNGKALEIGGLGLKLQGAWAAGVKKVLIPKANEKDLNILKLDKDNNEFLDNLNICIVNDIWDVISHTIPNYQKYVNLIKNINNNRYKIIYDIAKSSITLNSQLNNSNNVEIDNYNWIQLSGPNDSIIDNSNKLKTNINNLIEGQYCFKLNINLKNNTQISSDLVFVNVSEKPIIKFLNEQLVIFQNSVILDASNSIYDPDLLSSIEWRLYSSSNNLHPPNIINNNSLTTKVDNLLTGEYTFTLHIKYSNGKENSDSIKINVNLEPVLKIIS